MHKSIEWAAGLFEGEGCIAPNELILRMTDKDIVERFYEAVGCGYVKEYKNPDKRRPSAKTQYVWRTGKKEDKRTILSAMLPLFGNRRAHRALDVLDDIEL